MVLVAAILAIGVRSFFLQPFKIPTNSMYPTYAGMIGEAYPLGEDAPTKAGQLFRLITKGASHYVVDAPASGRVEIPIFPSDKPEPYRSMAGQVAYQLVPGKKFLVLSTQLRRYTFAVNGQRFDIEVPLGELPAQAEEWEEAVTEMTKEDDEISDYVRTLEERGDAETDISEAISKIDGDAIAAEFERYLRRRGPGNFGL